MKSLAVAGDYGFLVGVDTRAQVRVFRLKDGAFIGTLDSGEEVGGIENTGWVDMPEAIFAFQRKNGEYLVFVEEDLRNKIVFYGWRPNPLNP